MTLCIKDGWSVLILKVKNTFALRFVFSCSVTWFGNGFNNHCNIDLTNKTY